MMDLISSRATAAEDLTKRLRAGELSWARVWAAALCGHAVAGQLIPREDWWPRECLPHFWSFRALTAPENRLFAVDCAQRALDANTRMTEADRIVQERALGKARLVALGRLSDRALVAARRRVNAMPHDMRRSVWATRRAVLLALANDIEHGAEHAAAAAREALDRGCAEERAEESAWQAARCAAYLLKED